MAQQRLPDASSPPPPTATVGTPDRDAFVGFGLAAIIAAALADSVLLGLAVVIVGTALFAGGRRLFGTAEETYRSDPQD